jgi:hypothetical protein
MHHVVSADNLQLLRQNVSSVKKACPNISRIQLRRLKELTTQFAFSVASGDLILLENAWFVTHTGLLRLAHREQCLGIDCILEEKFCDPSVARWVVKATLLKNDTQSFVGYGDADPTNVSAMVRGAEMRVAETRAVNRALRKAYGIGICSVEEIGANAAPITSPPEHQKSPPAAKSNGNGHKVRDRLCQIIRQHKLDPELVKAYAVDYCGTATLKDAGREQVETFVRHLAESAQRDRNALVCHLNSYVRSQQSQEVVE